MKIDIEKIQTFLLEIRARHRETEELLLVQLGKEKINGNHER